jgi:hypothetical protein
MDRLSQTWLELPALPATQPPNASPHPPLVGRIRDSRECRRLAPNSKRYVVGSESPGTRVTPPGSLPLPMCSLVFFLMISPSSSISLAPDHTRTHSHLVASVRVSSFVVSCLSALMYCTYTEGPGSQDPQSLLYYRALTLSLGCRLS